MYIQTNNTIENPCFSNINKTYIIYKYNQNEKYDLINIKNNFNLIFTTTPTTNHKSNTYIKSTPSYPSHIMNEEINNLTINVLESLFYENTLRNNLEESLLCHIDNFLEEGYISSHIDEMNVSTNIDESYMAYDYYIQHPTPAVELKLNIILAKNPRFIN